jgi:hypothetical protein
MSDISTVVTTVAPRIADDGFAAVAETAAPESIVLGRLVRFRKGAFIVGRDELDISGAILAACGVTRLWQKWHNKSVVEQIPFVRGQLFPEEVDEIEDNGEPGEWQLSSLLYLQDLDSGADYTFSSSSFGGRRAVAQLNWQITNKRSMFPGVLPLVKLSATKFRSRDYGEIDRPEFVIVRWVGPDGEPAAAQVATIPSHDEHTARPPQARTPVNDLDDDIPF